MSEIQTVNFYTALGAKIPETEMASKDGLTYISAATAAMLAGRPQIHFAEFDQKPYLDCFGGALVAVDLEIPGTGLVQRTWLQVMDKDNQAMSLASTSLTDINNSRQRCLVKAIASVYGSGMSLYLGCDGDGAKALKMLGVSPESDLTQAKPVIAMLRENGAAYIEWGVGLSVCRITDPTFHWEVVEWDGKPYREVLGSIMVDVATVYKNKRQVLSLPVMDAAFNPLPVKKVTVNDWNKTVMRALTKCIAFNTGYGLSVYSTEVGVDGASTKGSSGKSAAKGKKTEAKGATTPEVSDASASVAQPEVAQPVDTSPTTVASEAANVDQVATQPAVEQPADADLPQEQPEAPAVVAEQVPAQVAAPAAERKVWPAASADALTRFKAVMHNRNEKAGMVGMLALFNDLASSVKFEAADKPGCFVQLLSATAATVTGQHIEDLLNVIKAHEAMQYLDDATFDLVAARLTEVTLHTMCDLSDEALAAAPKMLMDAHIAKDMQDVLRLAAAGNVTKETIDLLHTVLDSVAA